MITIRNAEAIRVILPYITFCEYYRIEKFFWGYRLILVDSPDESRHVLESGTYLDIDMCGEKVTSIVESAYEIDSNNGYTHFCEGTEVYTA